MSGRFAGIDIGSRTIELVVVDEKKEILDSVQADTGFDPMAEAKKMIKDGLSPVQPWDEKGFKLPGGKIYTPAGANLWPAASASRAGSPPAASMAASAAKANAKVVIVFFIIWVVAFIVCIPLSYLF